MQDGHIYKALKAAGFPQGGNGGWFIDPKTDERFYMPKPEEVYTQFVADPSGWEKLVEAMAVVWLENKTGVPYHTPVMSFVDPNGFKETDAKLTAVEVQEHNGDTKATEGSA